MGAVAARGEAAAARTRVGAASAAARRETGAAGL